MYPDVIRFDKKRMAVDANEEETTQRIPHYIFLKRYNFEIHK